MPIEIGKIVYSKAGRDKDSFFVVTGCEKGFVLICDGKSRLIQRPKRKSLKHIAETSYKVGKMKLETNKSIRHVLSDFKASNELVER